MVGDFIYTVWVILWFICACGAVVLVAAAILAIFELCGWLAEDIDNEF